MGSAIIANGLPQARCEGHEGEDWQVGILDFLLYTFVNLKLLSNMKSLIKKTQNYN